MMTRKLRMLAATGVLAAAGVGAGLSASAAGTTTAPPPQRAACMNSQGQLAWFEMTDVPHACADNLIMQNWNVQGPAGPQGPAGSANLGKAIANGPYPGATKLTIGSNSTTEWAHDGTLQTSWVSCPDGYVATGGGFGPNGDASTFPNSADGKVTIVSSAPDYINGSVNVALGGTPPAANADDAFTPNGWAVQGFNNGTAGVIVRPWVICAPAS